jgi:hypothetical protein
MTAPRLGAYQGFIIAAGELFSVLTAAAASPPPPERFMAAVSDAVAAIDRAHSGLVLVASQDALTAAAEVVQRAHRIREFLDPYQRSPHGLGELTQQYASACNAFTRTARDEVGNERPLSSRRSLTCGNAVVVMRACGCLPVSVCWRPRRQRCSVKDPPAPRSTRSKSSVRVTGREPGARGAAGGPGHPPQPVNTPSPSHRARIGPHAIGH